MTSLDAIRARYRAHKGGSAHNTGLRKYASIATKRAKADARARQFLERWMAGETHKQIADSIGIDPQCVTACIRKYRKRHPDIDLRAPLSAQRKEAEPNPRSASTDLIEVNSHTSAHTGFAA